MLVGTTCPHSRGEHDQACCTISVDVRPVQDCGGPRYAAVRRQVEPVFTTTNGDCIAGYRYPFLIANGVLANGGIFAVVISGRFEPSGASKVTVG
jgi:hypothetical protein